MSAWLQNLIEQLQALPPGRRLVLAVTGAGSLAFFLWLAFGASGAQYRALYRGLPEDEVARVADALRSESIEYRLSDGGTSILVPAGQVYEARIRVAGQGLPRGGGSGFELFDRPGFGMTEFVHRVNYVRAVQGELARSVERLEPVARARVQVVIPERRSVVAARQRKPRASVVLQLQPGRRLESEQVRAIVHLVASSIESLEVGDVTVVDDAGRLLAPQGDAVAGARTPGGAPAYQERVEKELAGRIESILEKTVGPGGVVARVRAEMDWTESETTEEVFDPDSQVARSEHRSNEGSRDGHPVAAGVPGIASNTPGAAEGGGGGGAASSSTNRSEETINYEISKIVSRKRTPMGRLERLSIAVLVADPVPAEGAEGEDAPGWSGEELQRFEELARQAAGFSTERGDTITVTSAPFRSPAGDFPEPGSFGPELLLLISNAVRALAVLLGLFAFGRFVLRPLLGTITDSAPAGLPARVAELEAQLGATGELAAGSAADEMAALPSGARSDDAVKTIRTWLSQG